MSRSTITKPGISIIVSEKHGSLHYDEELARILVDLWVSRHNLTIDQRERLRLISQEKYV